MSDHRIDYPEKSLEPLEESGTVVQSSINRDAENVAASGELNAAELIATFPAGVVLSIVDERLHVDGWNLLSGAQRLEVNDRKQELIAELYERSTGPCASVTLDDPEPVQRVRPRVVEVVRTGGANVIVNGELQRSLVGRQLPTEDLTHARERTTYFRGE